jgi:two-component system, OmpR family, sensor histidine kinase CreC
LRLKLLLMMLAIYCAGGYFLTRSALEQVRPRYLESMEASLVDFSVILASLIESSGSTDTGVELLRDAATDAATRQFRATIFDLQKTSVDLRIYVTDASGRVVFDSTNKHLGADFSRWNDVARTLRGQYGARSTRDVEGDDNSQVLYVAAPIRRDGAIAGVVTVGKPTKGINVLVDAARRKIAIGALVGGLILLMGLVLAASWVISPIARLTVYARQLRDGQKVARPELPGHALQELGRAFEEMRDSLEGRQHAERYTQALAHEVKAPVAAIRGAAELLDEDMPAEQRSRFLANIRHEAARIHDIIERLLELSDLENRKSIDRAESCTSMAVALAAADAVRPAFAAKRVELLVQGATIPLRCDRALVREAIVNLLRNALDFTPAGGRVSLDVRPDAEHAAFVVEDSGAGVPDFALPRVFDRFYSLPRPGSEKRSTGIGLALVREIAALHGGDATLENRPEGGARATLRIGL